MQTAKPGSANFFVDESGDPTFYDRMGRLIVGQPGCSRILLLGFVKIVDPEPVRRAPHSLRDELVHDPYFADFPSIGRTALAFHATDDLPEIRYRVLRLIAGLDVQAQFVVARKKEWQFRSQFHTSESEFYDHLVSQLFERVLHTHGHNLIYLAKRGSRDRQKPLCEAIRSGVRRFDEKWGVSVGTTTTVQVQSPVGEPCLSVIDYLNWAVFRAFTRGEMRYYRTVEEKVSLLVDLYDTEQYPRNWYSRKNPFDVKKITPL